MDKKMKQGKALSNNFRTKIMSYKKSKQDVKYDSFFSYQIVKNNYINVDRLANLKETDIPNKNEEVLILTTKNINSTEILEKINNKFKIVKIRALYNSIDLVGLKNLKKYDYEIIYINDLLEENKEDYNLNFKVQHLKFFFVECENDNYITVNNSANPAISSRFESVICANSKLKYTTLLNNLMTKKVQENVTVKLPVKNEKLCFLNNGGVNLLDFIEHINLAENITELSFVYYTAGKKFLTKLEKFITTKTLINFFQADKIKKMLIDMTEKTNSMHSKYKGVLKEGTTHCKITLIKTNKNHYVFISTANFNSNSRLELHELENNKDKYNYIFNFYNTTFV